MGESPAKLPMNPFSANPRSLVRLAAVLCYSGLGFAGLAQDTLSGVVVGTLPSGGSALTYAGPGTPANLGTFDINIVAGGGLTGTALAAFQRAAAQWEAFISDPITVNIDANLAALGPGIIGSTSSVLLSGGYNVIRNQMVADAADELNAVNSIVGFLPTSAQFTAFVPNGGILDGNMAATKANLKAMGFSTALLDGVAGTTSDGSITFSSAFAFDYDNSDGITPGTMDFETVAAHEIGHALGFVSWVDAIDAGFITDIEPMPWDLFRFRDNSAGNDPATAGEFTTFPRDLVPGSVAIFDDVTVEALVSTGVGSGDGQASHWKDSLGLGIMDPTLSSGEVVLISALDRRLLDVIGYEVTYNQEAAVPEASTNAVLLGGALLAGTWLNRRRTQRK